MSSVRITSIVAMTPLLGVRRRVRQERQVPRALDLGGELALVARAVPADAARDDLRALRQEDAQRLRVLVVDLELLVRAEAADLVAREHLPAGAAALLLRALRDDFDHGLLLVVAVAEAIVVVVVHHPAARALALLLALLALGALLLALGAAAGLLLGLLGG